jgi:hypothetical protein
LVYGQSWYLTVLPLTSFGIHLLLSKTIGTNSAAAPGVLAYTLAFRVGVATGAGTITPNGTLREPVFVRMRPDRGEG